MSQNCPRCPLEQQVTSGGVQRDILLETLEYVVEEVVPAMVHSVWIVAAPRVSSEMTQQSSWAVEYIFPG
jgi:hypothetical protein